MGKIVSTRENLNTMALEENLKDVLPKECILPPDSDDESFIVLGRSVQLELKGEDEKLISPNSVGESLEYSNVLHVKESLNVGSCIASSLVSRNDRKNHNECSGTLNRISAIPLVDLKEIQQKMIYMVEENIRLKGILEKNTLVLKKHYDAIVARKNKYETKGDMNKLEVENAKLTEELYAYKAECEQLKDEIKKLQENVNRKDEKQTAELLKSSFENFKQFELEIAQKKIASLEAQHTNLKTEHDYLKDSLSKQTEEKMELEKKIIASHNEVEKSKAEIDIHMRNQAVTVHNLIKENETLKAKLDREKAKVGNMEEAYDRVVEQLTAARMVITKLEDQRDSSLKVINSRQEEVLQLNNRLKEMKNDGDMIMALEAQLGIYKADFDAEHEQKNNIEAEKLQLIENLQHLQIRNQQLLEELEQVKQEGFIVINKDTGNSNPHLD